MRGISFRAPDTVPTASFHFFLGTFLVGLLAFGASRVDAANPSTIEELRQLSIEDLGNVEISSVSKAPEPLSRAAAAIYVISAEDIRRSGAVSLPEALRLAPNLMVARRDSGNYAIATRGFNTYESANKMLVLIDGRSIYTPLHGGVFWDQQQIPLDDIERIEVISGPGGTLWGANAFNGVINVITRHSADTQGGLVNLRYGHDQSAFARYGGQVGGVGTYRAYAMGFDRHQTLRRDGSSANDDWTGRTGGFRSDWKAGDNRLTLQGDAFDNAPSGGSMFGGNILGRWHRRLGNDSNLEVQTYFDKVERTVPGVVDTLETFDAQVQHTLRRGRHQIVWGGGHRMQRDNFDISGPSFFILQPEEDTVHLSNVFAQDSIALRDDLTLTLGTKLERSSLSGLEYMPNVRLGWAMSPSAFFWGAVSRAVRTPARFDLDLVGPGLTEQAPQFGSESVVAYEAGYRGKPRDDTTLSVSLYYNDYDDLRALERAPSGLLRFGNVLEGRTYGTEVWGENRLLPWWRLSAGLNVYRQRLKVVGTGTDFALDQHRGNDPEYQLQARSTMNIFEGGEFDLAMRAVDRLPKPAVPGYVEMDARLGWRVTSALDLSLAGFNLLNDSHPETGSGANRLEPGRTAYIGARWRF